MPKRDDDRTVRRSESQQKSAFEVKLLFTAYFARSYFVSLTFSIHFTGSKASILTTNTAQVNTHTNTNTLSLQEKKELRTCFGPCDVIGPSLETLKTSPRSSCLPSLCFLPRLPHPKKKKRGREPAAVCLQASLGRLETANSVEHALNINHCIALRHVT